ncbi:MAG TPA: DUF4038 domain-containing protein [Polyangiaceae bacterium]|nr:DUF4038 domain-containing protein [Polyangiaceae bacterium]
MSLRGLVLLVLSPVLLLAFVAAAYYYSRHADHLSVREPPPIAAQKKAAFPLSVSPGQRYLVDRDGAPFLIHGEAAWSLLVQLTREEAETYLEDRRRRGFNLLVVNLIEHFFSDHPPTDAYGSGPFQAAGDFSTPNPEYFSRAQAIVRIAATKGIVVLLCPAYLGGDGSAEGWYVEMRKNGPDKLRGYGAYVGSLFRGFDNVIWLAGGDYTPPAAALPLVDALQQGIKQAAPEQLQAAHWSPETSGTDVKLATTRLDLNTTYTYQPAHLKSLADYDHGSGRAHFLVESKYEDDKLGTNQHWLRMQAYTALLTGAMGQVFGNRWVWDFTRPSFLNRLTKRNWTAALDSPGVRSMGFVRALFAPLPWTELVPDETFEVLTTGQGARGSVDYPVLAFTRDRRLAIAYVPKDEPIGIELGKLSGPVRARFYDPTSGEFTDVPGSPFPASGSRTLRVPGRNASGDTDWVLLLEAR